MQSNSSKVLKKISLSSAVWIVLHSRTLAFSLTNSEVLSVFDAANEALAFVIFPVVAMVIPGPTNDEYCAQPLNKNILVIIKNIHFIPRSTK